MFAKIFAKLFGETEELEIQNLEKKVFLTGIGIVGMLVAGLLFLVKLDPVGRVVGGIGGLVVLVALFKWGFGALKMLLKIGSIGALFSRNVILGAAIIVICVMAAYFVSLFVAFIGIGRYIYLKVKKSQERG